MQIARPEPFPQQSHGRPGGDDPRMPSGIVFINRNGLRWCDVPKKHGPAKTPRNRWTRWGDKGIVARMRAGLAPKAAVPKVAMIDATCLKVSRTATGLRSKTGG
jgi:transposase